MGVQEHDLDHLQAIGEFAKQFSNFFLQHYHNTGGKKKYKSCCTSKYMTHLVKSNYKGQKLQTSASCDLEISTRVFAAG